MARTLQGKLHTWQLSDDPIASGDAGEVYSVVSLDEPNFVGMMKKPARIATGGTIQRQASQIAQESQALALLDGLPRGKAHPPQLLDEAPTFTQGTSGYFIVSEIAPGRDLSAMLSEARINHKPFPRRVIITVLDALFDLFSRAHKAGVLWNDVKLDHIYWDNSTGKISVIDWGNAQFLQSQQETHQRLRWGDYQQLVESLGGFLQANAPELYTDLGWEEFLNQSLDSLSVSVLARRISYQQQVIALKVMEYQSLIRVVLNSDRSFENFQKIQTYRDILEQIGAPWDQEKVLFYGQTLIEQSLKNGEVNIAVKTTGLVWALFDDTLTLPWHLLKEYFRQMEILTHPDLYHLARYTLNENWTNALWTLIKIAQSAGEPSWWGQIMPVLRQQASGFTTRPPYQISQAIFQWFTANFSEEVTQIQQIEDILAEWHNKGKSPNTNPFDYEIMDLRQAFNTLPQPLHIELKQSFSAGQEAIRALSKIWNNRDSENMEKALMDVAAWDPDRWGLINLAEYLHAFKTWLQQLHEGPAPTEDTNTFLENLISTRPEIEIFLGTTPWLKNLLELLYKLAKGVAISENRSQVEFWCPWLLSRLKVKSQISHLKLETKELSTNEALDHFQQHLKAWSDLEAALSAVNATAPEYHPTCQTLVEDFQKVLSLNYTPGEIHHSAKKDQHPMLMDSYRCLNTLENWRQNLAQQDINSALKVLDKIIIEDWKIVDHSRKMTLKWQTEVLPVLDYFLNNHPVRLSDKTDSSLVEIYQHYTDIHKGWQLLIESGTHQEILATLSNAIESTRLDFIKWRQESEKSGDPIRILLYHTYLQSIRKMSNQMLNLSQHIRQANLNYTIIAKNLNAPYGAQISAMETLLDHLGAIEAILISDPLERHFPKWVEEFLLIKNTISPEARQQVVLSLSDDHPLYTWLLKATTG